MLRSFSFSTAESFKSDDSRDFAAILMSQCRPAVRDQVLADYGLKLVMTDRGMYTQYDGRRVGIGYFQYHQGGCGFTINPKSQLLDLKLLLQALGPEYGTHQRARFERLAGVGPVENAEDDFTTVYLLNLLHSIGQFSLAFGRAFHKKKTIFVKDGVRGRPLVARSMVDMAQGKTPGFRCEILDDDSLRDYVTVLVATAMSIVQDLEDWSALFAATGEVPKRELQSITARLGTRERGSFTFGLLSRLCRPPFPFGMRDTLYRCLRYWQWKGNFRSGTDTEKLFGYHGLIVQVDKLFEDYVRKTWTESSSDYARAETADLAYHLISEQGEAAHLPLYPDEILRRISKPLRVVVDAKYKEGEVKRDDIYQVLAYVSYGFPNAAPNEPRVGVLVYPNPTWSVQEIVGFSHPLFVARMPIESHAPSKKVCEFLDQLP